MHENKKIPANRGFFVPRPIRLNYYMNKYFHRNRICLTSKLYKSNLTTPLIEIELGYLCLQCY